MLHFVKRQTLSNGSIAVPFYVRAALGLQQGTAMCLAYVQSRRNGIRNELLTTVVDRRYWKTTWSIHVLLRDRMGLLADIVGFLKENGVEVLRKTSTQIDNGDLFKLCLSVTFLPILVDPSETPGNVEPGDELRVMALRSLLIARFIDDLEFDAMGEPHVQIRQNHQLLRAANAIDARVDVILENSRITIPSDLLRSVRSEFEAYYPHIPKKGPDSHPKAYMVADPEEGTLRILVVYQNTGHANLRAHVRGSSQELATLTRAITEANLSICQMVSRMGANGRPSVVDLLLQMPPELDKYKVDSELERHINGLFSRPQLEDIVVQHYFHKDHADEKRHVRSRKP